MHPRWVRRVEHLGYADSGAGPILHPDPADRVRFVRAEVDEAAGRLAGILQEEGADLLISYDHAGGYGHPDHVRVHEVGVRAASFAGGIRVVEATLPREPIAAMFHFTRLLRLTVRYDPEAIRNSFTPRLDHPSCERTLLPPKSAKRSPPTCLRWTALDATHVVSGCCFGCQLQSLDYFWAGSGSQSRDQIREGGGSQTFS